MGQLCCFPFSQAEEKISKLSPALAELLRVSKRLVEDAVSRALQQYKQETLQNGGGPQAPGNAEETVTKTGTTANSTTDHRK
uniref:A kinase (PRKA) anchor protein 7 n=1 Tax=Takifugu rubripes TaxID=31033 RepID=A0A674PD47_TAKRU